MRKKLSLIVVAGALVTALAILLTDPVNGEQLVEELENEEQILENKLRHK